MSYVWGPQGPAFEYPTCYRIENRFLVLRAAVLWLGALIIFWLAMSEPQQEALPTLSDAPQTLADKPQTLADSPSLSSSPSLASPPAANRSSAEVVGGSAIPHVVIGLFFVVLGATDLVAAARQRKVRLEAGQPASLIRELSYHASGAGQGASWLLRAIADGRVDPPSWAGSYQSILNWLSARVAFAPVGLQSHLRLRVAQLLFSSGLLLALGVAWAAAAKLATLPLAALLFGLLALAQLVHNTWVSRSAPSPLVLGVVLAVTSLVGVVVLWTGSSMPRVGQLQQLALPAAAACFLACLVAIELLSIAAARAQLDPQPEASIAKAEARSDIEADFARVAQEVDVELVRRWVDGVPNRRYIRRLPGVSPVEEVDATLELLEETQPTLPAAERERLRAQRRGRSSWLLAMGCVSLLLTTLGVVMWVRMADALMTNASAPWAPGATALGLVVAGGYALRAVHMLWSRIEVQSTIHWIRLSDAGQEQRVQQLDVHVVLLRSVFFAAAEHGPGSRTILAMVGQQKLGQKFIEQVRGFASRSQAAPPVDDQARKRQPVRTTAAPDVPVSRGVTRFCPVCGTPVLQGARFCQNCGNTLVPG